MSITFRSRQAQLMVSHDEIFHVGVVHTLYKPKEGGGIEWCGSSEEWDTLQKLPDPDMVNRSYWFREGENRNELTLEREDAIEGMRAYTKRCGGMVVELDENGEKPALPEGTMFVSKIAGYQLHPAVYKGCTTAEGKTFNFNMGSGRNEYITADPEEISLIRSYVRNTQNCTISDPSYVPPVIE